MLPIIYQIAEKIKKHLEVSSGADAISYGTRLALRAVAYDIANNTIPPQHKHEFLEACGITGGIE